MKAKESKDKAPKTKILVAAAALGAKTKPLLRPRADAWRVLEPNHRGMVKMDVYGRYNEPTMVTNGDFPWLC